ncbi:MAG TPA: hypothetical protein VLK33_22825 [Terriglobales bacterium]|nr:hypothetical protein [Terriglobales bacterium]
MRLAMRLVVAVCLVVFPRGSWGQSPITIPTRGDPAWDFSPPNDSGQQAPSGYEGRTDSASQTATGKTPATAGKRIVSHFTLGNQVQTCPNADGEVDGTGVFNFFVDYTDAQATQTTTQHIELNVKAKYTGQVGDNGLLEGPVNAEIDYNYAQSGRTRQSNGALTNTAPTNIQQHITMPILVSPKAMAMPDVGAFSGGDPTKGHYAEAVGTGMMLSYWGGVYYSIAQIKWYGGQSGPGGGPSQGYCVDVTFDPPSYTLQPPLGTQAKVKATVKTKSGEIVGAQFVDAHSFSPVSDSSSAGFVSPSGGKSSVGAPIEFIYTAPNRKIKEPGFGVGAISRAGNAVGVWHTGLGTGWSGQISCSQTHTGDAGGSESGSWSNFDVAQYTVVVKDGVASGSGFHQIKNTRVSKRPVANYANPSHPSWADDGSSSMEGTASDESKGKISVNVDNFSKSYSVSIEIPFAAPSGKLHTSTCIPNHGCTESDQPFGASGCFQGIVGNFTDPNQLHGSIHDVKTGIGNAHTGTYTYDMKWDLARQGTTQK